MGIKMVMVLMISRLRRQSALVALLAAGDSSATVWGCDLTDGYVRINADYTT